MRDDIEEAKRLNELAGYGVLDTDNEPEFDAIVREAAARYATPIALISLIDEERQWFKAYHGLDVRQMPRSISFCTHAIRGEDVFTVQNADEDPRFADNPLVTSDPNIRFYAGAPLKTPTGRRIGTLCVIDEKNRGDLNSETWKDLERLAAKVMEAFDERRRRHEREAGSTADREQPLRPTGT